MRDALSIFDQLVSFCGNKITYQGVIDNLNVLDYEYYFRLTEAFLKNDVSNSLLIFNEILNRGFDAHHFITGLSSHFRDLLVSKDTQTIALLEVGADIGQRYHHQSIQCPSDFLIKALKINNDCDLNYRISSNKRLLVELNLIRLSQLSDEKKKDELNKESLPSIQKIEVASDQISQPAKPIEHQTPQSVDSTAVSKKTVESNKIGTKKPISISINNPQKKELTKTDPTSIKPTTTQSSVSIPTTGLYTDEALWNAWKEYVSEIPEIPTATSFILNNQPEKIEEGHYRIKTTNVFQSNEIRKLLPGIIRFIGERIGNNSIRFSVELIEENNLPRSNNPEETLKLMMEENAALKTLKNDLNLEID